MSPTPSPGPNAPTDRAGSSAPRPTEPAPADMWAVKRPDGSLVTGWVLMPLRLFLGVTFLFAGLQKLANPNFLKNSSPVSIHAQLVGATHLSPIHALISHLIPIAPGVGLVIAIGEVAIGVGVLVGLWTRVAAVAGMALSLGLFLTVSYHSSPYFTGSDIVFFFGWTPLVLGGAGGAPALDTWLARRRPASGDRPEAVSRRTVLSKGALTGLTAATVVVVGGAVAALGRAAGGATTSATDTPTLSGGGSGSTTTTTPTTTTTGAGGGGATTTTAGTIPPHTTSLGPSASVPVGGSAAFTVPGSGDPGLVIQQTADDFVAFNAICPHQGCTVAYQASAKIIACPCHGSEFNPQNGNVVRGPATYGLTRIKVIKGANGNLYVPK
jgi:thiosulfate dehydrogenase [quinone] large subunit